jgi:LuxR family transcriptional regulator, activator of conjugal transfer of Ti plasmids
MWNDVREFTHAASAAKSVSKLNEAFGAMASRWGFESFTAIQVSSRQRDLRAPLARSFGVPHVQWLQRYREAGHVHRDAGIRRIMHSTAPYWWRDVENESLSRDERLVFDEARTFGLRHGLVVPVRVADGSIWSCLMVAERLGECDELQLASLTAANIYVGRGVLLQGQEKRGIDITYRLTERQREVVLWLGRGLTVDEIAAVLERSSRTVAHQIEDAKRRLSVRTQAALVYEALARGEVSLEEIDNTI